jgi:hypothetical protein
MFPRNIYSYQMQYFITYFLLVLESFLIKQLSYVNYKGLMSLLYRFIRERMHSKITT